MPETMTPVATPAAPSTPSPAPAAPSPAPSGGDPSHADTHSALDAAFAKADGNDAPQPKPEPVAPAAVKPPTPPKAEPKPAAAKPGDKPAEPKPDGGPKALREELERVRTENAAFKKTSDELAAKIKDFEARGKDAEALKARLEQRDAEFNAMQGELRALKREASPEFKKQYEEPFTRAANQAERLMKRVTKADGTPATFDEFVSVYQTSKVNYGRAAAAARELFGDDQAPLILEQVRELDRLETAKNEAFEAEKQGWAEKEKAEEGRKVQERENDSKLWAQINEDLKNSVEDYRDPVDDAELATARQNGLQVFDHQPRSKQEHLVKSAHIRHRLGAYEAQKLQIARQTARIAELEASIEDSKVRQPGAEPSKPSGGPVAAAEPDYASDMIRHIKANS